ncbi:hypothetical protein [Streptomyces sp. NPDC001389]|uniref:hypothetical protein n=1 Tax=unclassified Streptomyces TaxID=2593676 RepID=UPI0036C0633F
MRNVTNPQDGRPALKAATAAEHRRLAGLFDGLRERNAPSLCAGWSVREVVAAACSA